MPTSVSNITSKLELLLENLTAGRIGRKDFFLGAVTLTLVITFIAWIALWFGGNGSFFTNLGDQPLSVLVPWILISLVYVFLLYSLISRRLHDLDYPWWLVLPIFIPNLGLILFTVLAILPSKSTLNDHGHPLKFKTVLDVLLNRPA